MSGRHLTILAAVAIVAIVAALWTNTAREPTSVATAGTELLAGFEDSVNDVTAVHIFTASEQPAVTLRRDETRWRVAQKGGYAADSAKVRKLLLDLGAARLLEEKTSNPDYYARIGVQDAGEGDNVRLEFDGIDAAPVIVGDLESVREAVYVRRAGEAASWLASGAISVESDPLQWLDREILDVPASRIASVEIRHPDGETVTIAKDQFGQSDFAVADVPDGRELERANIANPIAAVLSALRFDDVFPADEVELDPEPVLTRFSTFDGLVIEVESLQRDASRYARLRAGTDAATAARFQTKPEESAAAGQHEAPDSGSTPPGGDVPAAAGPDPEATDAAAGPGATASAQQPDMSAAIEQAGRLNRDFDGWVFLLPKYKYDQLTRRLDDLLAAPAETE